MKLYARGFFMSNKTGRRRRTIPGYVSIEIASFRRIAASFKNDAEFGRWVKKAFDDMSIGCILDDTDPRIRAIYTEAFDRMEYEYKRKNLKIQKPRLGQNPSGGPQRTKSNASRCCRQHKRRRSRSQNRLYGVSLRTCTSRRTNTMSLRDSSAT